MSYILDALKQSQQAREKQQVPGLTTVQDGAPEPGESHGYQRIVKYAAGVLCLVLLAAGVGWWWGGQPLQTAPEKPLAKVSETQAGEQEIVEERAVESALVSAGEVKEKVVEPPETDVVEQQTESLSELIADQSRPSVVTQERLATNDQPQTDKVTESQMNTPNNDTTEKIETSLKTDKVVADNVEKEALPDNMAEDVVAADTEQNAGELPSEPQENVPHFRQLPYDIQQDLPTILYSVHLYSPNPEGRMVKIEGVMRREGDEVLPGVELLEITPNGAIFMFRDYKFRVPVN